MDTTGMSSEKIREALVFYRKELQNLNVPLKQHPAESLARSNDEVLAHCHWMAVEAEDFLVQGRREKAMRWLCFIQGCIFTLRRYSIDKMKNDNRPDTAV